MSLSAGTRLGPYQILSALGAGGMGEVYKAHDTRLDRSVAIKVLPAAFVSDADRLVRFEREAKAIAALSHPNILAIFDTGVQDSHAYVVTELLDGETLAERLQSGPLPVRKAIEIAVQIARGLAAAHTKGIVHRDLKPANVFVLGDGQVKILDFGLAKLVQPNQAPGQHTSLPTTSLGTEPGVVMGTIGYMSPEQARGLPADHRSDIFSFGSILYEMLSGRKAFNGESAVETLSSIVKDEPPDLSETNTKLSPGLVRLVRHCLEKAPGQRFQSASDLAYELETSSTESGTGPRRPVEQNLARLLAVAVVVAATAALFVGVWLYGRHTPAPVLKMTRLTFRRGTVREARFAPDGQIIYGAEWDGAPCETFSTRALGRESRSLFTNAALASVSPLGEIAIFDHPGFTLGVSYTNLAGTLARVALDGGAPKALLDDVMAADWAPDGQRLAVVRFADGKSRIEFPIGTVLYETGGGIGNVRVSPKGDQLAFFDLPSLDDSTGGSVAVVDLQGHERKLADGAGGGLAWSQDSSEVWFGADQLYAVTLQGQRRLVWSPLGGARILDIARDGRVLVARETVRREAHGRVQSAKDERNLSWLDYTLPMRLTSDGRLVLLSEYGEGGGPDHAVYVRAMDGSPPVRIGDGAAFDLSPDGKWVLAASHNGTEQKVVLLPTGPGQPREIPTGAFAYEVAFFSPDGKRVVFGASSPGKAPRMYIQDLDGGPPRPVTSEGLAPRAQDWSPPSADGRIVVRDGSLRPFLLPIVGGTPVPINGGVPEDYFPGWTADGMLYAVRAAPLPARVFRLDPATGRRELWKEILPADPGGVRAVDWLLVTPDGSSYVYGFGRYLSDLYLVEGLQ